MLPRPVVLLLAFSTMASAPANDGVGSDVPPTLPTPKAEVVQAAPL